MGIKELKEIIKKHKLWRDSKEGGKQAILQNVDLTSVNLNYVDLSNAIIKNVDLNYAILGHVDLSCAILQDVDLSNADLSYVDLSYAVLKNVDLISADLHGANLRGTNLSNVNLICAILQHADFRGAVLRNIDLQYAYLNNCVGNGREIKSLRIGEYTIVYSTQYIAIGWQQYPIESWFNDESIKKLNLWKKNKDFIKILLKKYPAEECQKKEK